MRTLYQCEKCKALYEHPQTARDCEASGPGDPIVQVGDLVTAGDNRFSWYDGSALWVAACSQKNEMRQFTLAYVVVAIVQDKDDPHQWCYVIATDAMTDENGYRYGRTYESGHIPMRKIVDPSTELVEDAKRVLDFWRAQPEKLLAHVAPLL